MGLDERVEMLVRGDGTVQQEVVLAVDTAACRGEDIDGYQLHDGGELGAVDLCGDQTGWHQVACSELRGGVEGRLGELTNQLGAQGQLEGSDAVSGTQGHARHAAPLNQRG
jgi:hypothetical protein